MEIQAICHACLLIKERGTTLLIDPWIKGTVFMGGWKLDPDPLPDVLQNLPPLNYIYLTHEHSDHTHVASLKELFAGPAKNATLLIPKFMTDRFLIWLKGIFSTVPILEMAHGREYRCGDVRAWSYQFRNDDSTIALKADDGYTILNTNDTFVKGASLRAILAEHARPDVLISQFSVSNAYPYAYTDYKTDPKSFPWDKDDLKKYCVDLIRLVQPKQWVPYQSFVSFCRAENNFLNEFKISLDEIEAFVAPQVKPARVVKLYCGDTLRGEEYVAHPRARDHFYAASRPAPPPEGKAATREELLAAGRTFEREFKDSVAWLFRRKLRPCGFISEDDNTHFVFDPVSCRLEIGGAELRAAQPDLSWTRTSQRILTDSFRLPWGMASLLISGSMRTDVPAQHRGQDFLFWAAGLIRHTGYFDLKSLWFLKPRALATMLRRRHEAYDILIKSIMAGSLTKGNIEPRPNTVH